jgi:hypothetical protein
MTGNGSLWERNGRGRVERGRGRIWPWRRRKGGWPAGSSVPAPVSCSVAFMRKKRRRGEREKKNRKGRKKRKGEKWEYFPNIEISMKKNKTQFMKLV